MYDLQGTKEYWSEQTKKGDNPCHYHNKWQDAYAFRVRTGAFHPADFEGIRRVVDIGCGIGDYMAALSRKATGTNFLGFDFPFNVEVARRKYAGHPHMQFEAQALPEHEVIEAIQAADAVVTTTVYVHLAPEARQEFIKALGSMRRGSKVFLLEYSPDAIPSFQANLSHKKVEPPEEIIRRVSEQGFSVLEVRPVNFLDSFLFFHVGKNAMSYYVTLGIEWCLRLLHFPRSKYKLFIFQKKS